MRNVVLTVSISPERLEYFKRRWGLQYPEKKGPKN